MSKLVAFLLGIFLLGIIFTGSASSGAGSVATRLTANVAVDDEIINVESTENFLDKDIIFIGNEKIKYSSKTDTTFEDCARGYDGTKMATHNAKLNEQDDLVYPIVYNQETNIINTALNANITVIATDSGWWSIITVPYQFFISIPSIMTSIRSSPFLQGDMAIVGYIFLICCAGIMISIAMGMMYVAASIVKMIGGVIK